MSRQPLDEHEIFKILLDLEHGKATQAEIMRRHQLQPEQVEQWRQDYPFYRLAAARTKTTRLSTLALIVAVACCIAAYLLNWHGDEALSDTVAPVIVLAFFGAGLGFVVDSARRGMVTVGRRRRAIHRDRRPLLFWTIIGVQTLLGSAAFVAVALLVLDKL